MCKTGFVRDGFCPRWVLSQTGFVRTSGGVEHVVGGILGGVFYKICGRKRSYMSTELAYSVIKFAFKMALEEIVPDVSFI